MRYTNRLLLPYSLLVNTKRENSPPLAVRNCAPHTDATRFDRLGQGEVAKGEGEADDICRHSAPRKDGFVKIALAVE